MGSAGVQGRGVPRRGTIRSYDRGPARERRRASRAECCLEPHLANGQRHQRQAITTITYGHLRRSSESTSCQVGGSSWSLTAVGTHGRHRTRSPWPAPPPFAPGSAASHRLSSSASTTCREQSRPISASRPTTVKSLEKTTAGGRSHFPDRQLPEPLRVHCLKHVPTSAHKPSGLERTAAGPRRQADRLCSDCGRLDDPIDRRRRPRSLSRHSCGLVRLLSSCSVRLADPVGPTNRRLVPQLRRPL